MPTFAVTIDHSGTITDVQPSTQPLHEVPAAVPTEEGETVERLVHADNANAAREIVQAQLDAESSQATAPPPGPEMPSGVDDYPPPPTEDGSPAPPPEEGV